MLLKGKPYIRFHAEQRLANGHDGELGSQYGAIAGALCLLSILDEHLHIKKGPIHYPRPVLELELLGSGATLFDRPSRLIHLAIKLGSALVVTNLPTWRYKDKIASLNSNINKSKHRDQAAKVQPCLEKGSLLIRSSVFEN